GPQLTGISGGRFPDDASTFNTFPGTSTPGAPNFKELQGIVLSEVLSHSDDPYEDSFEFHNPTAASIDMSGWYVSGSKNNPRKFRIPEGSVIEPNGYLAFYRYQFQSFPNLPTAFGLNSAHGESVWLFEADRDDKLTGYRTGWEFPAAANAVPFIRHLSSIGPQISYESRQTFGSSVRGSDPEDLLSTFRRGRGAPNALPLMDTMVISEIKHQPLGTSFELRNVFEEYLELRSIVATNVALYDLAFTSNTWRVAGDVEYQFPTGVVVPPHGAVVLVAFDPKDGLLATEFRRQRGVPADALLFGPYEGMLHGGISLVELERPDIPQFCFDPDFGWTPYLVADHVAYSSTAPWPAAAAFPEFSLQRRVLEGFGNDPVHWMAGVPSTGAPNGAPAGPVPDSTLPSEQSVAPGGTLTLSASESASGQFFQWSFNGIPIAGANQPIFQISSASDEHTGVYGVLSSTAYGAAYQTIRVTVQTRPVVTAHPVSRTVARGGSAVFHASARGAGPYLYQWFKNGAVLTDRTNVALHLTGVSSSDVGTYAVRISNAFGEVTTSQATLTLLAGQPPVFVEAPKGVFFRLDTPIPAGGSYELSSVVSGDQPIRYQWQKNEVDIPNATSPSHRLSRFQASDAGFYRLIAQNHLGSVTSAPVKVILLQPPGVTIDTTPVVVDEGGILRLRALATGTPRLYYQWQVDGRNINASFCSTLELPDMRTSDAGCYRVVVRNAAGTIVSETVEVQVRPRILQLSYRNRNATLNFRATPGKVYGVYGSTNLIQWDLLAIVPGIQEQVTVVHTNAPPVICLYKVREL
ncbi:MAG: hypothetical protein FJ405_08735, partial [Verrucomicrobia bacterium]|nr:hypothetical protein [Verrucomicrobiota bacterium]